MREVVGPTLRMFGKIVIPCEWWATVASPSLVMHVEAMGLIGVEIHDV